MLSGTMAQYHPPTSLTGSSPSGLGLVSAHIETILGTSGARALFLRWLLIGAVVLASVPSTIHAETVSYLGRDFRVDNLKEVDAEQVAVDLDGQSILVRRENVGRTVFKIYAHKPELLGQESLDQKYGAFIATVATHGDKEEASLAIQGVLAAQDVGPASKASVFRGVAEFSQGERALLQEVLTVRWNDTNKAQAACIGLGYLKGASQAIVKKHLEAELSWMLRECYRPLIVAAQEALGRGARLESISILESFVSIFGDRREFIEGAYSSLERLKIVHISIESADPAQLEKALKVAGFDAILKDYYEQSLPQLITEFSRRAFARKQPAHALQGLVFLDFSQRNNVHHELVLKAVSELSFDNSTVLAEERVRKMLWLYASKDEAIKQQALSVLSSFIERAAGAEDPKPGIALLDVVQELRPDPSVDNDALRSLLAESFVDAGDIRTAESVLAGVGTRLPWMFRVRILLKSDYYMLVMVLLGLVVVLRWIGMFGLGLGNKASKRRASRKAQAKKKEVSRKKEPEAQSKISEHTLNKQVYRDLDEYGECLSKFKLKTGASLADIKVAYRHVVKTLHPDLNPNGRKDDTVRFIELTKAYERLLVLHEERQKKNPSS